MTKQIAVTLASDTLQVFGTVNDAEVNWVQTDDTVWTATCERSKDHIYDVRLTVMDGFGIEYDYQVQLTDEMYLITDRTREDALRVLSLAAKWSRGTISDSEILEWNMNMKGAYNASTASVQQLLVSQSALHLLVFILQPLENQIGQKRITTMRRHWITISKTLVLCAVQSL